MRMRSLWCGAAALALLASGWAVAQDNVPARDGPLQSSSGASTPDHTVPPPPEAQPKAPLADQAKPAAVGPAQASTAGTIASDGPPGATPQTMPSTISTQNAALDKLPITALQLPLSIAEKSQIAKSVAGNGKASADVDVGNVGVADFLPRGVPLEEFSANLKTKLPQLGAYKYVNAEGKMLIIDPPNFTVVGEIAR